MRREIAFLAGILLIASVSATASASSSPTATPRAGKAENYGSKLVCGEGSPLCAEANDFLGYRSEYTGHDEPSVLFYSNAAGAGNESNYQVQIPTEPPILPKQDGSGGTFNFENRIAFWFGMDLCDNQSAPEYTHATCTPSSDTFRRPASPSSH